MVSPPSTLRDPSAPLNIEPVLHQPIRRRWRPRFWVVALVFVLAVALVAGFYHHYQAGHLTTDQAFVEARIVAISPRVSGLVKTIKVQDGQLVQKGDVLVELDPVDFQATVDQAQAAYDGAMSRQMATQSGAQGLVATTQATVAGAKDAYSAALDAQDDADDKLAEAKDLAQEARTKSDAAEQAAAEAHKKLTDADAQAQKAQGEVDRLSRLVKRQQATLQDVATAKTVVTNATAALATARQVAKVVDADAATTKAALAAAEKAQTDAEAEVHQAETAVADARAKLALAPAVPQQVAAVRAQVSAASADTAAAQAALSQAKLALSYASLTARSTGRVAGRRVEVGSYVRAGQEIMQLVEPEVWIVAYFKETRVGWLHPGQDVTIRAAAYPGVTFHGLVQSMQPATAGRLNPGEETAVGSPTKEKPRVAVKIVFDPPPDLAAYHLLPGMSVTPVVDVSNVAPPPPPQERSNAVETRDRIQVNQ